MESTFGVETLSDHLENITTDADLQEAVDVGLDQEEAADDVEEQTQEYTKKGLPRKRAAKKDPKTKRQNNKGSKINILYKMLVLKKGVKKCTTKISEERRK